MPSAKTPSPLRQAEDERNRFTPPGAIPDAAYWGPNDTYEDAVRKRDAARAQDAAEEARARGYAPSHPAGRGWVPQSRDLGIPGDREPWPVLRHDGVEYVFPNGTPFDLIGKIGGGSVFTRELRVRFLDHLAFQGNARAAALSVNVSHETAYRARRQDAAFAALWDAALVHARAYGEQVLASRALDGVEVAIVRNGEVVGYVTRQEPRFMALHMARLDRHAETNEHAVARAARFDELLAQYAGHPAPEGFAEAAGEDLDRRDRETAPELPPTRKDYVTFRRSEAVGGKSEKAEARRMHAAGEAAGAEWDAWHEGALATVGGIVESPLPQAGEPAPDLIRGGGGGPVDPGATSDTPTPNPSREREGDPEPANPTLAVPAQACPEQRRRAGIQRAKVPEGPPESTRPGPAEQNAGNPVTSVNTPAASASAAATNGGLRNPVAAATFPRSGAAPGATKPRSFLKKQDGVASGSGGRH